ncbi:MAG TPA: Nif3-like dinuclear metal center hexameric protein [Clostridiaceae bacterium]|nr:Nif3-like dinuclear metal center hexameric protein [Clostridiaceae bacterium]
MTVKVKDIICFMNEIAPKNLAEQWDNVGLLVGCKEQSVNRVMVILDATSKVVEEAVGKKIDMLVTHHPVIFKGLKSLDEENAVPKILAKLIRNNISVFCAHTNLDAADGGVNEQLAKVLGLTEIRNLNSYREEKLFKLVVFVPVGHIDEVRNAICNAGAGWIGNYSDCSFMTQGTGTFKPLDGSNPFIGKQGNIEKVSEYRLETIVPEKVLKRVIEAMISAHPYEEVAYDIYPLEIKGKEYGLGKVGILEEPMSRENFVSTVKKQLGIDHLRLIGEMPKEIRKVAVFCGSFDENWHGIIREKADVLVTGDIKYHAAVEAAERKICVIDAGHYATEKVIVPVLAKKLNERFPGIEVISSCTESDPIRTI